MRLPIWALALPIAFANCICSNKLAGDLTLNGEPFAASSCRNGAIYGFAGVEVRGKDGWRIRFVHQPTGEAAAIVFRPDSDTGASLGTCGVMKLSVQNSTVNNVKNVEGSVDAACAADGMAIAGRLTFGNCH